MGLCLSSGFEEVLLWSVKVSSVLPPSLALLFWMFEVLKTGIWFSSPHSSAVPFAVTKVFFPFFDFPRPLFPGGDYAEDPWPSALRLAGLR